MITSLLVCGQCEINVRMVRGLMIPQRASGASWAVGGPLKPYVVYTFTTPYTGFDREGLYNLSSPQ